MTYAIRPLLFDPKAINGLSEKIVGSHYESDYIRAVKPSTRSVLSWLRSTTLKPPHT
jgi:hypothetical protein